MEPVRVLREDLVLVDWGPMTLAISAFGGGQPLPVVAAETGRRALRLLSVLADFQGYLKTMVDHLPGGRPLPPVVARARRAVELVGAAAGEAMTPLAAVAGAVADELADFALSLGADRVVVNNGGDLALRLSPGQEALVGVQEPGAAAGGSGRLWGRLKVRAGQGIGGVASSGWRGRSLSKGLADLATAWSAEAALADAAATVLGNAARVASPAHHREPARHRDPASDLGEALVTAEVDALTPGERAAALAAGLELARGLHARGLVGGGLLVVQGDLGLYDPGGHHGPEPLSAAGPGSAIP